MAMMTRTKVQGLQPTGCQNVYFHLLHRPLKQPQKIAWPISEFLWQILSASGRESPAISDRRAPGWGRVNGIQ